MHGKIMVWGLGNPLQGDDRAGIEVAEELLRRDIPEIIPIVCETTPGNFIPLVLREKPDELILVDAADMGLPSGSIRLIPTEMLEEVSFTSHDLSLELMLRSAAGKTPVTLIGIQPERIELLLDLSPSVQNAVERVVEALLGRRWAEISLLEGPTR